MGTDQRIYFFIEHSSEGPRIEQSKAAEPFFICFVFWNCIGNGRLERINVSTIPKGRTG
jgi:hypothetical protein